MKTRLHFSIIIAMSVLFHVQASFGTDVSGDVWGTWTIENSPYNVIGEVIVPPESTLTIEPGVTVSFSGHYKFIVDSGATLFAEGTVADSILFTVQDIVAGWHGIRFNNVDSQSRLSYCVLEFGNATGNNNDRDGGAVFCRNSIPMIINNTFRGNRAGRYGGAISCTIGSDPTINNNLFQDNLGGVGGGAIYCVNSSSPMISNNDFIGNISDGGGAVYISSSKPEIQVNYFTENQASQGGAIYCSNANSVIGYNDFSNNRAVSDGGAIFCDSSDSLIVVNNIFAGNMAGAHAGAIYIDISESPELTNNVFTLNSAGLEGGAIDYFDSVPVITNCILWDNSPTQISGGTPLVTYSDIQGGWSGKGNIDIDPLFADEEYHLQSSSPCIDTGDPKVPDACRPPGLNELRSDMGAYGGAENCGWPPLVGTFVTLTPTGPTTVRQGETLYFNTYILNNRENVVEGDYWLSVMMPDSSDMIIPEGLLNYANPLHGQIFPYGMMNLSNEFWIHPRVNTGSYQLIGRIGQFPGGIIYESAFGFQVVE